MDGVKKFMAQTHRTAQKDYGRIFVATYEGKPAGVCALKFNGDGLVQSFIECFIMCMYALGLGHHESIKVLSSCIFVGHNILYLGEWLNT